MRVVSKRTGRIVLLSMLALPVSGSLSAQQQIPADPNIIVEGELMPDTTAMAPGPEIKGVITARKDDKMKVLAADGTTQLIFINEATKIKGGGGLFGGSKNKLGPASLLNGLPVTVKTMQAGSVLLASQVSLKKGDLKTANMIRNGTAQGFAEQTAATAALRGRMGDIDNYNIKGTTNVYFDTGKAALSSAAKAELCNAATQAEGTENALMLVVGYTDSVGSDEYNQTLSEKRASSVINHLQQNCRWKPYRMLTPTGMAESDPLADNETAEGKAQNRRVAVNILVSKAVDGM
jgi:outer membrane protein OmpA-like peptidoglycan-associated protein